jgi:hypothetical protein
MCTDCLYGDRCGWYDYGQCTRDRAGRARFVIQDILVAAELRLAIGNPGAWDFLVRWHHRHYH